MLSQAEYRFIYEHFRKECDAVAELCGNKKVFTAPVCAAVLAALIAGEDPKVVYDFCHGYEGKGMNRFCIAPNQWRTQIILKIGDKTPYSARAVFLGTQQAILDTKMDKPADQGYRIFIPEDQIYNVREKLIECIQARNAEE